MQTDLDLSKGLHTDFEPVNQPQGTYRYLSNSVRQLSGSIENEKGTNLSTVFNNSSRKILGSYVLDEEVIICSVDNNSNSEIGVLSSGIYTTITTNSSLNFQLGSIIKLEGKKNFKNERIIYLVEKNGINPARAINLDDQTLLASPTFADDIILQLNPSTPAIEVSSVTDSGSLPTGIYQAAARLLTRSTNAAPFGILSSQVPIIDDSSDLALDKQDGAPPQSSSPKAINFTISNIDTSYAYLEIAIITYVGTANVSSINLVSRIPIDGRPTITFTYSSLSQNKQSIDLEALTVKPVSYNSASSIVQKDGILTLANLTAETEDFNFQSIANNVQLRYKITEVPYRPAYKDPVLAATLKGYQRDEVYSFAITPEFKNQYSTTTYHVPSRSMSNTANTLTREPGQYLSNEQYPLGKDYPVGYVAHHKMPTIAQEPLLVTRDNQLYLRILSVEVDFTQALPLIPESVAKKLNGFSICRQLRSQENKSIVAQGIANTHFKMNDTNFKFLSAFPKYTSSMHFINGSTPLTTSIGFYSPETVIYQQALVGNLQLKVAANMIGTQTIVHDLRTHDNENKVPANFQVFMDYNSMETISQEQVNIQSNSAQYIKEDSASTQGPGGANITIPGNSEVVNNYKNNGYLYLKLAFALPAKTNTYQPDTGNGFTNQQPELFYYYRGSSQTDLLFLNGKEQSNQSVARTGYADRYLYNITRTLTSQYGPIYDATYIYCGSYKLNNSATTIYGGDTFINKFSVVTSGAIAGGEDEIDYTCLNYYFCESTINTAYRHYNLPIGKENESGFIAGTTPYYPKLDTLYNDPNDTALTAGILNLSWSLGHGRGYNKQYSFENNLITYYPTQLAEERVTKFANRVIYSEQSVEGEQVDSYRVFLPNNYHDIPKDKGPITELFVHNNKYYIHTSGSLYLSSFNERVSQTSSIGEVYLGNGGVFSRPSEPILTISGSYAGTLSSSGVNTPFGRFFIDETNSKVYMLTDTLKEISDQGMRNYFMSNLTKQLDSPSTGSGYVATYDQVNYRYLLTKINQWTISYSPQLNSWSSFHSYLPYHYINYSQRLYSVIENELHRHNSGAYGVFYDNLPVSMRLDVVLNDAATVTKTFDNLKFYTTSQSQDAIEQHYDTFNTLQCYNQTRNTGKCRLVVPRSFTEDFQQLGLYECFAKLKSNEFRVALPNDLVLDVNQSIFASTNLANSRQYRPSLSGKWLICSLEYTNLRNNHFVLHTIGKIIRQRIR